MVQALYNRGYGFGGLNMKQGQCEMEIEPTIVPRA
jgi:hypothetical protein